MSAFVVSKEHIDAIVSVAVYGPTDAASRWEGPRWAQGDPRCTPWQEQLWREVSVGGLRELVKNVNEVTGDELGAMLWEENRRSVDHRYDETNEREAYTFSRMGQQPTIVETFKLLDCLEYQSCEHPGWGDSEACRFVECLRGSLIGALPGYNAAPWEWSTPVSA